MRVDQQLQWIVASFRKLMETEEVYYAVLNDTLAVIDLPQRTLGFLQTYYAAPHLQRLPDELLQNIRRSIPAKSNGAETGHTFSFKKYPPGGHFLCRGYPFTVDDGATAILLKLIPYGPTEDFTHLTAIGLTPRETELLSFLPLGYPNSAIATAMDISGNGVKKHLNNIAAKLNAKGRTEILYKAMLRKRELVVPA